MAGQEKEMGLVDLEHFISQQISDSKKVNNIIEQLATSKQNLEKEVGGEVPSFYGEIFNYLSANGSQDISKLIDKDGKLKSGHIQNIYKKVKEKHAVQKVAEEEKRKVEEKRQQDINEVIERMTLEELKERIDKIDFKDLKIEDLEFLRNHAKEIVEDLNEEDHNKVVDALGKGLGTQEVITGMQKLYKKMQKKEYKLTEEDKAFIINVPDELANTIGFDKNNLTFSEKSANVMTNLLATQAKMKREVQSLIQKVEEGSKDIGDASQSFQSIKKECEEGLRENGLDILEPYVIGNSFEELYKQNQQNKQNSNADNRAYSFDNSNYARSYTNPMQTMNEIEHTEFTELDFSDMEAEFSDGLAEFDALETQAVEAEGIESTEQQTEDFEMDFTDEFTDALAEFDLQEEQNILTEQTATKSPVQQMQDAVEFAMDVQMSKVVDYAEMSREEPVTELESDKEDFVQEAQIIQEETSVETEIAQDIEHEEPAQAELQDYEMEVEEKTGLAGLFSKVKDFIQNIPAIQGLFAKTSNQERLGDGKPQVTREDGIKQISYFGNGSLEPWTVRARNFAIGIGTNIMEAISKVTKVSSKEDNAIPINQPTIIKSQEKTDEEKRVENMELHPMQEQQMNLSKAVEQQGRKLDDNPWAVDVDKNMEKEALAKMAKADKTSDIEKSSNYDKPNRDDDDGTIGRG